jgi:3-phosphoshikimate 1-carboxyvinyltransferase
MLSALLMVAPFAGGEVSLRCDHVRPAFVEMTQRLMGLFGAVVEGSPGEGFLVQPSSLRGPGDGLYQVEADATAASYFIALPFLTGGELLIEGIGTASLQGDLAFAGVMEECGLRAEPAEDGWRIRYASTRDDAGERAFDFASFSDTFLTFAAVAPYLPFPVRIRGVGHTRFQECDRVEAAAAALRAMGARVRVDGDDLCVGGLTAFPEGGCLVETRRDHRVAMSFALAGCRDRRGDGLPWLCVRDPACAGKTFPSFFAELEKLYRTSHDKSDLP